MRIIFFAAHSMGHYNNVDKHRLNNIISLVTPDVYVGLKTGNEIIIISFLSTTQIFAYNLHYCHKTTYE